MNTRSLLLLSLAFAVHPVAYAKSDACFATTDSAKSVEIIKLSHKELGTSSPDKVSFVGTKSGDIFKVRLNRNLDEKTQSHTMDVELSSLNGEEFNVITSMSVVMPGRGSLTIADSNGSPVTIECRTVDNQTPSFPSQIKRRLL